MKNILLQLFIFSLLSCSNSNHKNNDIEKYLKKNYKTILIDSIESEIQIVSKVDTVNNCHMCPGLVIINKCKESDTISLGQWGKPPKYKIIDNYVVFESNWQGGEQDEYSIIIYDLRKSADFAAFEKIYTSKKYVYNDDGSTLSIKCNFNLSIVNDQLLLTNDSTNFIIQTNSEKEIKVSNYLIKKIYKLQN